MDADQGFRKALYVVGFIFIINEEIFTGMQCLTMHPPSN